MFNYVIIDRSKRTKLTKLITVESIVAVKVANSKRAALAGFEEGHTAVLESSFQGKGDRRFREKIKALKHPPKSCYICGATNSLMSGSIDLLCPDCFDDIEADI